MSGPGAPAPGPWLPAPGNRWGLPEAIVGFAGGVLLSALLASVAASVAGYHTSSSAPIPVGVTAADLVGLWIGLVGAAVWTSRFRGSGSLARDFGWRIGAWWDLPLGAAIGVFCQYGLIPLLYLPFEQFDKSLAHRLGNPARHDTAAAHTWAQVVILVLFLAVGAPLVEELFFRGLLLRSLLGRTPAPVAILLSAVLFALAHFEAVQFAGLAVFGVVLGLLAWRTGRLAPGIGAHAAFNAVAVIAVVHVR